MSTTAIAPRTGRRRAATGPWTGTRSLLRLALRRDRIRLSVWVASLTLMMVYAPNAIKLAYPEEAQRQARVNLMKTPAAIIMGGPMFGGNEADLGAMMANELMLTMIIATSILSILTVIRHTRAEEESGAAELVLSSVVGRYARTYAALILVGAVNAVLAVTMTLAMASTGFSFVNTAAMCLGITGAAMVFGAVAAVTAQLWRQSRTATGAAMAVLALAAFVRGIGDVINNSGSVLSWFSPIAWAQQMRAFVDLRWWPFALVGRAGDRADGRGRRSGEQAPVRRRQSPVHRRTSQRARDQIGARPAPDAATRPDDRLGGRVVPGRPGVRVDDEVAPGRRQGQRADSTGPGRTGHRQRVHDDDPVPRRGGSAYVVSAVLRLLNDEEKGLGEVVLAGAVSRWRWLLTAVASALVGSAVLMFFAGLGNGLGAGIAARRTGNDRAADAWPVWRTCPRWP